MHFPEQVTTFLGDVDYSAPGNALYVIFIGGNDVVDAARALPCDPTGSTSVQVIVGGALSSVGNNITALYRAGARKFLVLNSPDLGLTPAFNPPLNIPVASGFASCFSLLTTSAPAATTAWQPPADSLRAYPGWWMFWPVFRRFPISRSPA